MKYHTDKNGNKTLIKDLETSHLKNIIKYIERRAKEGIVLRYGGGGPDVEDMWYDEDHLFDEEAKSYLNYNTYLNELKSRTDRG
jgi:hypothetical protein